MPWGANPDPCFDLTERIIGMTEQRPLLDTLADMTAASVARADLATVS